MTYASMALVCVMHLLQLHFNFASAVQKLYLVEV